MKFIENDVNLEQLAVISKGILSLTGDYQLF